MKFLLTLTHTDRAFDVERCTLSFFQERYAAPDRLETLPAFESLPDAGSHQPYNGSATVWIFDDASPATLRLVRHFDPGYKVQHAICRGDHFVLAGPEFVEIRDPDAALLERYSDPWMSGVHTCFAYEDRLVVATSASDAVLVVDLDSGRVTDAFRMPEALYGRNYPLERTDDTRAHYITNDLQLTHVNAAWPAPEGIYVSTLIHGAIGLFDWNGGYRELLRGYWGCHGVRKIDDATLLFTDSCLGCACLLDIDSTRLLGRIDFGSRWLHDTETPDGRHFFGALADHNRLALFDRDEGVIVAEWPMERFGQGLQFMSVLPLDESGLPWLDEAACAETLLAR